MRLPPQGPEGPALENEGGRDRRGERAGDAGRLDRQGQHEEETREGEEAEQEPAQHPDGGSGALQMVSESGLAGDPTVSGRRGA